MRARFYPVLALVVAAGLLAACSEDPQRPDPPVGVVSGEVDPAAGDFVIVLETAGSAADPLPGPFHLRGENVRWLPGLGAIAVDLSITNAGPETYPEPVGLTFTDLLPDSVLVLDPDNGIQGPGAAILFGFANDDGQWTPGETSFPRTVTFLAYAEQAVAFGARVDIGTGPLSGSIGGLVWFDADRDGEVDPHEPGIPGVTVVLEPPDVPMFAGGGDPLPALTTTTGPDGRYLFANLRAGFYTVRVMPRWAHMLPEVPEPLHVLLVEAGGRVSSFLEADFGLDASIHIAFETPAEADATVRADVPSRTNDNYGCAPYIAAGTGRDASPDSIRGLVRFILPPVSDVGLPDHALLLLQVDEFRDGVDQVYQLGIYPVLESGDRTPWIEGDGTDVAAGGSCVWVDEAEGVAWYGAGDGGDPNNQSQPDYGVEPADITVFHQDELLGPGIVGWDVTDLVRAWMSGELPNHGLVIRDLGALDGGTASFRSVWFVSKEGENLVQGRQGPRLGFVYEENEPRD